MIRRVTTYDGALLEQAHPLVHDVVEPEVARTMTSMLEDVVQRGTGTAPRASWPAPPEGRLVRPTTFTPTRGSSGFTPRTPLACGSATTISRCLLANRKRAPSPRCRSGWNSCKARSTRANVQAFQNVESLDKVALTKSVKVDTPDNAPTEAGEGPTTLEAKPEAASHRA